MNILLLENENLKPFFNPLSPTIKQFGYKVGIQLFYNFLVIENNNYLT